MTAALLLPVLPWWEAVCLAAIIAPTEVALIDALLDDERIPERIRHTLSVESGFYDGFCPGVSAGGGRPGLRNQRRTPWQVGVVPPSSTPRDRLCWWPMPSSESGRMGHRGILETRLDERQSAQLATVAVALLCFETGGPARQAGLSPRSRVVWFSRWSPVATRSRFPRRSPMRPLSYWELVVSGDDVRGIRSHGRGWQYAGWRWCQFAAASAVVRMVAVLIALIRSDLPMYSRAFIGWFGLRGIGHRWCWGLIVPSAARSRADVIVQVVVVAVISLLLHSLTAPARHRPGSGLGRVLRPAEISRSTDQPL